MYLSHVLSAELWLAHKPVRAPRELSHGSNRTYLYHLLEPLLDLGSAIMLDNLGQVDSGILAIQQRLNICIRLLTGVQPLALTVRVTQHRLL